MTARWARPFRILLLLFILPGVVEASPHALPVQEAYQSATLEKRSVRVRGFLHHLEGTGWVLAAQPRLKSCCLTKEEMAAVAVMGEGLPYHPDGGVWELSGLLHRNEEGRPILSEARPLVRQERRSAWGWPLMGAALFSGAWWWRRRDFRK